jgi:hypothetical protein
MVVKRPLLERALTVTLDADSKWALSDLLAELENAEARIARFDARIAERLGVYAADVQLVRQIPGMHDVRSRFSPKSASTCLCSRPASTWPRGAV